jgi:hypothetical protein
MADIDCIGTVEYLKKDGSVEDCSSFSLDTSTRIYSIGDKEQEQARLILDENNKVWLVNTSGEKLHVNDLPIQQQRKMYVRDGNSFGVCDQQFRLRLDQPKDPKMKRLSLSFSPKARIKNKMRRKSLPATASKKKVSQSPRRVSKSPLRNKTNLQRLSSPKPQRKSSGKKTITTKKIHSIPRKRNQTFSEENHEESSQYPNTRCD